MKRTTWMGAGAGAAAAVALLAWAFAPRPVEVEVATATTGRFEATIDEDGKTRLRDRFVVSAPLTGMLTRVNLREGDAVQAGDVIATLTPALSPLLDERSVREQQARLDTAEAQVQRARARIDGAKVSLLQARQEVQRTEQLARQGFVSLTKLDTERLAVQAAEKELEVAVEEQHIADHGVEQARAALLAVRAPRGQGARAFALRAPVDGQVLRVALTSEGTVALGTPLIELGDTRRLEIVADLLTTDALQARPGSRVRVERWGGGTVLDGRVRRVEPAAFTKVSALGVEEQRVKVLIDLTTPPAQWQALGDGFRVGVRIVTTSVDDAVKVPVGAVFPLPAAAGKPAGMAVFTLRGGSAVLTPVQIGGRNGAEAWVQSGLAAGASVLIYPPAKVTDGARVSVRKV